MQQLVLDIAPPPAPSLDNFVAGRNAESLATLVRLADRPDGQIVFLWGPEGCGRTHLLRGFCERCGADYLERRIPEDANGILWAVDGVEALDAEAQIRLFNLINRVRAGGGVLVATGSEAPVRLPLREDLAARLGWGLVFQLHPLSDAEKEAALAAHARSRGFDLAPDVTRYLLNHARRDLPSLLSVLDALDRHSLAVRRPITVPLVRDLLQSSLF